MKIASIVFFVTHKKVLLAPKRRGFSKKTHGRLFPYGGEQRPDETMIECAIRESQEESLATPITLVPITEIDFFRGIDHTFHCHVFLATQWHGTLQATDEMDKPEEFYRYSRLPVDRMLPGDPEWIHEVLKGRTIPKGGRVHRDLSMTKAVVMLPKTM
jgi:8-oxo-dGTP diphosphatase